MASINHRFLRSVQVRRLHLTFVANATPTQPGLLDSAVDSPVNVKHYGGQANAFQLAASLAEKIMTNHAFMDGNKRTALVAADMFLKINGYKLQEPQSASDRLLEGISNAHVKVTINQWSAKQLGEYYESIAAPAGGTTSDVTGYYDDAIEA